MSEETTALSSPPLHPPPSSPKDTPIEPTFTTEAQRIHRWNSDSFKDSPSEPHRPTLDDRPALKELRTVAKQQASTPVPQKPPAFSSSGENESRASQFHMRLMPDALDRLRVPGRHDWDQASAAQDGISAQEIMLSHIVEEDDREPLYHLELLSLFRQRLRLLALLGMILLPIFHLFYNFIAPETAHQAMWPHTLMFAVCLTHWLLAARITNLVWARLVSVVGYALICTGASLAMSNLSQSPMEDGAVRSIQYVIFAAHSQILLSIVLLPLTLWESLVLASIIASSLAWSAWWILPIEAGPARSAQVFVLATTAVFVLCVANLQNILRRRAFNSTFDLSRSASRLEALSTLDTVTGGFNRLYLQKTLTHEINRAARFSHPLSVMMFDLDNFKAVNDTQGHTVGDEVLRLVWQAAIQTVRDVDTVARYGGDEFVIVLPETEAADAYAVAERLQETAAHELTAYSTPSSAVRLVTLSVGIITVAPQTALDAAQLITLADERLYEAKRTGKNRIAV